MIIDAHFSSGLLMSAQVKVDDEDLILTIDKDLSRNAYCLLALVNKKLYVYKIGRRTAHRDKKIGTLLHAVTDHFTEYFNISFFGLAWGKPAVVYYRNFRVLTLNNTQLFREDGFIYPILTDSMLPVSWDSLDTSELLNYIDYYTFKNRD